MDALIYLRCSTDKQANSLAIQERMARSFCDKNGFNIIEVVSEVASGKDDGRSGFAHAVNRCLAEDLTLIATKIDRLARRISTVGRLIDSGVRLRIVSLGNQPVSKLVLAVFSAQAECERDFISLRTKEALAHLKLQGVKLGNPNLAAARKSALASRKASAAKYRSDMIPVISELQAAGISTLKEIATALNLRGYTARRGGKFYPATVGLILNG
tara:strand:- start:992 stop:1633 length:642 start_codon:yes stop_codon:yes gene_type:complete